MKYLQLTLRPAKIKSSTPDRHCSQPHLHTLMLRSFPNMPIHICTLAICVFTQHYKVYTGPFPSAVPSRSDFIAVVTAYRR